MSNRRVKVRDLYHVFDDVFSAFVGLTIFDSTAETTTGKNRTEGLRVVVASAGIPAGFFEIGPLSRASRRAKVPSVANVEESVVEATL